MTTRDDIRRWLESGKRSGHKWLIIVCDTFEYDDYPVYADTNVEFHKVYAEHDGPNMQKVMESYNIDKDWEPQLAEFRCHERP